jgi:hypothetical protein
MDPNDNNNNNNQPMKKIEITTDLEMGVATAGTWATGSFISIKSW